MYSRNVILAVLLLASFLLGCSTEKTFAPVVNAWQDPNAIKSRYRVQKDDTLYSIAWAFDLDYRDLAKANHLVPPYQLKSGQTLSMPMVIEGTKKNVEQVILPPSGYCKEKQIEQMPEPNPCRQVIHEDLMLPQVVLQNRPSLSDKEEMDSSLPLPTERVPSSMKETCTRSKSGCWCWPACGRVVKGFALQSGGCKGIEIAGELGEPVVAIAPGKVVYSGSGLKGYGNLIIIKHSDNYLSAYAYNKKLLVKEGQLVKAGTEIGKMGQNDSGEVLLHFEIRQNGKPVNPLLYL